jgi:hypothetical protein
MKSIAPLLLIFVFVSADARADVLCFSPVKEKGGDKATKRRWWQPFDYRVQVDKGPLVRPRAEESTPYTHGSKDPEVKIWLGDKIVESFRISSESIEQGRNCVYFKNSYETWSVVEAWQAKKLCSCRNGET